MATVLHACPAFADVFSGQSPKPEEFEGGYDTFARVANHRKFWWWWAARTHAVRALAQSLNLPLDPEEPNAHMGVPRHFDEDFAYRTWGPLLDRGERVGERLGVPHDDLRAALGDPEAGMLYTERHGGQFGIDAPYGHSDGYIIAVNIDGTRCAYQRV